jgi:hypothetical protein
MCQKSEIQLYSIACSSPPPFWPVREGCRTVTHDSSGTGTSDQLCANTKLQLAHCQMRSVVIEVQSRSWEAERVAHELSLFLKFDVIGGSRRRYQPTSSLHVTRLVNSTSSNPSMYSAIVASDLTFVPKVR